jgi:hypothetical protein
VEIDPQGPWGWRQRLVDPRLWVIIGLGLVTEIGVSLVGGIPFWFTFSGLAVLGLIGLAMLPRWQDKEKGAMSGARIMLLAGIPTIAFWLGIIALIAHSTSR